MPPMLREAIRCAGSMSALAEGIGMSRQAIYGWKTRIPAERVVDIERVTGISRAKLRPDLFGLNAKNRKARGK